MSSAGAIGGRATTSTRAATVTEGAGDLSVKAPNTLHQKWGNLSQAERHQLIATKSEQTWGKWNDMRNAKAKSVNPNTHFNERHGPGTTLEQQETRAATGVGPDGSISNTPPDSSRFLSERDMGHSMQRADSIRQLNGNIDDAYTFHMDRVIGEGYLKAPLLEWIRTENVTAVYRSGHPYTMYPLLKRLTP